MIRKIDQLKCFGIFQNFSSPTLLQRFEKFNLFYGWNGSGKSTLSRLFASIEHRKIDADFTNCMFKVTTDAETITHDSLEKTNLQIRVFNQNFIKDNIEWDTKVNSILVIAEEKIEERKRLEEVKKEIKTVTKKASDALQGKEHLEKQINGFYSSSAKTIKESFKVIDTKDTYYFNYDKTKFERFLNNQQETIYSPASILTEEQRSKLVRSIQPVEKGELNITLPPYDEVRYAEARIRISNLLSEDVIAKTIDRLRDNPAINIWVRDGLGLHVDSDFCEFCMQPLPANRLSDLKLHFNDAYSKIMDQIQRAMVWVSTLREESTDLPDASNFYQEFQDSYLLLKQQLDEKKTLLAGIFNNWKNQLESKQKNPFQSYVLVEDRLMDLLAEINQIIAAILLLVSKHNRRCQNFTTELTTNQRKLELHYTAELVQGSELKTLKKDLKHEEDEIARLKPLLTSKLAEENKLEAQLINEAKGAEHFNRYLHKFLGRTDISLKYNKEAKGYNIMRGRDGKIARNLSEGEKTAIAFVYFVIKLQEKGNKIEETIIVVDDPISSFDSNHLFHSYAFLKNICEKAAQLFVLTHNFQYFRLVRDWFLKKNEVKWKNGERVEKIRARVFAIESNIEEERSSRIINAHTTLQEYNSEYHYVFNRVFSCQEEPIDNLDKAYLTGNLCRKLLEGFLTFKFPKARKDFRSLMNDCCEDNEMLERIYRFINKYSHNQLIEFHDTPVDNLISEGDSIVKDVLGLMEKLDIKHYGEMKEICTMN